MSSFFPLFTKYSSQSWQYISLEHHLLIVAMHFERSYQELWRKHVEIKRPKDGVLYDQFPFNHDVTKETVRLRNKTCFILFLFNLIFLTNKVVQDWIKLIDLESRAEIKLIVIFFRRWLSCLSFHRRWSKTKDVKKCKPELFSNFFYLWLQFTEHFLITVKTTMTTNNTG